MNTEEVRFVDTTFRDGSQSLWAMGMRHGMMAAVAEDMDKVGFNVIEIPGNAIIFKKIIRDLKENPFDLARMLAKKMPNTVKSCMGGGLNLNSFGTPTPPVLGRLFLKRMAEIGALNRVQVTANTGDQIERAFPTLVPMQREFGMKIAVALSYSISPRHTDEHYAEKTEAAMRFDPDVIYLKDQGGLLTVDRIRTLLPTIVEKANGVPVELHSHCTTGLAPVVYMEALQLGVNILHTGVPPLADGSAQPSVLTAAKNARLLGYTPVVDEELLKSISDRLMLIAREDKMPIGQPLPYDYAQFVHQIPGGVISNLRFQLAELGMADRLDEVVEETITVRRELGYPIMITPYSQYVSTQAALNIATGERYKVVIDELIRFAKGAYGEDSGYGMMDQNLRDRFLSMPRAKELAELDRRSLNDISEDEARKMFGGTHLDDEEILMRAIMQSEEEVAAMHAAGPPKQYLSNQPLLTLLKELEQRPSVRYVKIERGSDSVVVRNTAKVAPAG